MHSHLHFFDILELFSTIVQSLDSIKQVELTNHSMTAENTKHVH